MRERPVRKEATSFDIAAYIRAYARDGRRLPSNAGSNSSGAPDSGVDEMKAKDQLDKTRHSRRD